MKIIFFFEMSAAVSLLEFSYNVANFSLDILLASILI